jgi:hypothetical protein
MSTKPRPNERTERQTDTPTPTSHAQRRYRQRINPREPEPADRLRELFALAELEGDHPAVSHGIAWVVGDVVLVTDSNREAIKTVLRRRGGGR